VFHFEQEDITIAVSPSNSTINKHIADASIGENHPKEKNLLNETKWRHTLIKGFRISPALLAMVESECQSRRTNSPNSFATPLLLR
jgi:hypothetical protein